MEWPLSLTVRSIAPHELPRAAALVSAAATPSGEVVGRASGEELVVNATTELSLEFGLAAVMATFPEAEPSHPKVHYTSTHEPYCSVRLIVPGHFHEAVGTDLLRRHGRITKVSHIGTAVHIDAVAPLIDLLGYTTEVHALTRGSGSAQLSFIGYEPLANRGAPAA